MERRDFMAGSSAAVLASLLSEVPLLDAAIQAAPSQKTFQLTKTEDPRTVKGVYESGNRDLTGSEVPYVYAYFDVDSKNFQNPLDIKPKAKPGSYTLEPSLFAFNIRSSDQANFKKLKNQVQLAFNATAPVSTSDRLTWLFMNAIDVFGSKPADKPDALTKFSKDAGGGVALQTNPKVSVNNGIVNLQITAFGQKQDGFWRKFLDILAAAVKSPVVGTALKGFGIPSLAGDALTFVDHAFDVFADQEKLVPLWKTGGLEFAVQDGANALFKMNEGFWVTVDSGYARDTNFLEGHALDLEFQSFRLTDKNKKPVDANYLITQIKLVSAKS